MDNMAYLQQISSQKGAAEPPKTGLGKFVSLKTAVIALAAAILLVAIMMIVSLLGTSENKEQDLLVRSWYKSTYLLEVMDDYSDLVKSSDLRSISSSLVGVLKEIILKDGNILLDNFGVEVDDLDESEIALEEEESIATLRGTVEQGRLSGTLDRIYLRELTLQTAYLQAYQSEINERTEDDTTKAETEKAEANLKNIYSRLDDLSI